MPQPAGADTPTPMITIMVRIAATRRTTITNTVAVVTRIDLNTS
jgi:hypothetical protein